MSYILEALRKADRERNLGQVPTLEARVELEPESQRPVWPWWLAAALLANVLVLALWFFYPRAPEAPVTAETVASEPPLAAAPAVADYLPPPITVVEEPIREPAVAVLPSESPEPALARERPVPVQAESQDEYVEEPAVEEMPAGETPFLRDMPPEYRRSLPAMKLDAHFYTEVPGRSFVMINLRKYKPGERLMEGPQVIEIVSAGVVLSYQGREFLLTP